MKTTLLACGCLLSALCVLADTPGAGHFRLVKTSDRVTLYERWIPGAGDSRVRELKAVFAVECGSGTFLSVLRDPVAVRSWNRGVVDCAVRPGPDPHAWLYYARYDIPWPFDDQDCLLAYRLTDRGSGTTEAAFHSVEDPRFPVTAAVERITRVRGSWLVRPEAGGRLLVTYRIATARSEAVPRWVSDPVVHRTLLKSLEALIAVTERHPA